MRYAHLHFKWADEDLRVLVCVVHIAELWTSKIGLIENHDDSRTLIVNDGTSEISGFVNGVWPLSLLYSELRKLGGGNCHL